MQTLFTESQLKFAQDICTLYNSSMQQQRLSVLYSVVFILALMTGNHAVGMK